MKHVGEAQPATEAVRPPREHEVSVPPSPPERSPDQDDFNESLRWGMRGMAELLRRRRKQ